MSGRRQSFGVLGVGTVSVSDAQDVDTAAGGMAFDRLIVQLSAGIPFSRSIKHVMYVSLLIQCRSQGSATPFGFPYFYIRLVLVLVHTCQLLGLNSSSSLYPVLTRQWVGGANL